MNFTYDDYHNLLLLLQNHGYEIVNYNNWIYKKRCVILRHDIDTDIEKALKMAHMECKWGIKSTYFVLLTSDFYNIFSRNNNEKLNDIIKCGHEIGLHFDEMNYPESSGNIDAVCEKIQEEAKILEKVIGKSVEVVSMHRPSREILEADLQIPGIVNSYGRTFFHDFKYLSDSRRHWREPVEEIIRSEQYERLHILTHAFWYGEKEKSIHDTLKFFVNSANEQRYDILNKNFTDLNSVMGKNEIC